MVALFANAADGKEPPIVIGKASHIPGVSKELRIPYYSYPKAWVNTDIMESILNIFNKRLFKQERRILLFIDNVSSHEPALKDKLSKIKIIFLPKNTTSRLKPWTLGSSRTSQSLISGLQPELVQIDSTDLTASSTVKK